MEIEYIEEIAEIGDAFIKRFVLSWENFQIKHKDWIEKMSKQNYPINKLWYDQAYMWDRMDSTHPGASMKEALDFLREHSGTVFF